MDVSKSIQETIEGYSFESIWELVRALNAIYDSDYWHSRLLPFFIERQMDFKRKSLFGTFDIFTLYISISEEKKIVIEIEFAEEQISNKKYWRTMIQSKQEAVELMPQLLKQFVTNLVNLLKQTTSQKIGIVAAEATNYIRNLNSYDALCILQYSAFGDRFVNEYLRGILSKESSSMIQKEWKDSNKHRMTHIFPLTAQLRKLGYSGYKDVPKDIVPWLENPSADELTKKMQTDPYGVPIDEVSAACKLFAEDIKRIIRAAPILPFDYIVYRGLSRPPILGSGWEKGFLSTSIYVQNAKEFTVSNGMYNCCLIAIQVPKGTPFLLIPKGFSYRRAENEVLFPPNTELEQIVPLPMIMEDTTITIYRIKKLELSGGKRKKQKTRRRNRKRVY